MDATQTDLFSFVSVEERVPPRHPIRALRSAAASVFAELRPQLDGVYARSGRAAIAPEQVLRAMLIWGVYSLPSERQLREQLDYNLLFRWFVGLEISDPIWPHSTFHANRRRLQDAGVVAEFMARVLTRSRGRLLANPHFTVNQSLFDVWLGQTSIDWR